MRKPNKIPQNHLYISFIVVLQGDLTVLPPFFCDISDELLFLSFISLLAAVKNLTSNISGYQLEIDIQ